MRRKGLLFCILLLAVSCLFGAAADGVFTISTDTQQWNWDDEQLLAISLTNATDADLTDLTLSLSPAVEDGKEAATPVFYRKGIRRLNTKNRKPSFAVKSIAAGASSEYTLKYSLQNKQATKVSFTLQVLRQGQVMDTKQMSVTRSADSVGAYAVPLLRGISVGHVLKVLKLLTAAGLLGTCIRLAWIAMQKKKAGR